MNFVRKERLYKSAVKSKGKTKGVDPWKEEKRVA